MADFTQTPFNMALAYLERMDNLLKLVNQSSIEGNVEVWLNSLEALFMETAPRLKKEDYEEINDLIVEVKKLFNNWEANLQLIRRKPKFEGTKLEMNLNKINIKIRFAMNNAGLLMPQGDDPRFALRGGRR